MYMVCVEQVLLFGEGLSLFLLSLMILYILGFGNFSYNNRIIFSECNSVIILSLHLLENLKIFIFFNIFFNLKGCQKIF